MSEHSTNDGSWPMATLDPIRGQRTPTRIPGGFAETVFDVPYETRVVVVERSRAVGAHVRRRRRPAPHQLAPARPVGSGRTAHVHRDELPRDGAVHRAPRGRLVPDAGPGPGLRRGDGRRRGRPGPHRYAQLEAVPLPGGRFLQRRLTPTSVTTSGHSATPDARPGNLETSPAPPATSRCARAGPVDDGSHNRRTWSNRGCHHATASDRNPHPDGRGGLTVHKYLGVEDEFDGQLRRLEPESAVPPEPKVASDRARFSTYLIDNVDCERVRQTLGSSTRPGDPTNCSDSRTRSTRCRPGWSRAGSSC